MSQSGAGNVASEAPPQLACPGHEAKCGFNIKYVSLLCKTPAEDDVCWKLQRLPDGLLGVELGETLSYCAAPIYTSCTNVPNHGELLLLPTQTKLKQNKY